MKRNPKKKPEEGENKNALLRGVSAVMILISVSGAFFFSQDSAVRQFELLLAVAFFLTCAGVTYDLIRKLRLSHEEGIEPQQETNKTPRPRRGRMLLNGLTTIVLPPLAVLFTFAHFIGYPLSQFLSALIKQTSERSPQFENYGSLSRTDLPLHKAKGDPLRVSPYVSRNKISLR